MSGGDDELLVLVIGDLVSVDGKRLEENRSLRLLIKPAARCPTEKRPGGNCDHLFRNRLFLGRGLRLRLSGFDGSRRRRFKWRERGAAKNAYDRNRGEGENGKKKCDLEFGFQHTGL